MLTVLFWYSCVRPYGCTGNFVYICVLLLAVWGFVRPRELAAVGSSPQQLVALGRILPQSQSKLYLVKKSVEVQVVVVVFVPRPWGQPLAHAPWP